MKRDDLGRRLAARLPQLQDLFARHENVRGVFLFGSQVDGTATPHSDIDLAVLYEQSPDLTEELALGVTVSEVLGTERVDLVNLNRAGLLLRQRAISGRVLYERDADRVSDFIEFTLRRYVDHAPRLAAYYRGYDRALEEAYGLRPG